MEHINIATSPEFHDWWFSIPEHIRNTMQIRSAVVGFNAAKAMGDATLHAEYDDQAGASL